MKDSNQNNLVDADDFCRRCRGKGGKDVREPSQNTGRMISVWYSCTLCEGTGLRTVRVLS